MMDLWENPINCKQVSLLKVKIVADLHITRYTEECDKIDNNEYEMVKSYLLRDIIVEGRLDPPNQSLRQCHAEAVRQ